MPTYLSQALHQELLARTQRLTSDPASGDALKAWMKLTGITRDQVIRSMLIDNDLQVRIDDNFDPAPFESEGGKQCLKAFDMLLSHPDFRDGIVVYMSGELRGNQLQWLQAFCERLQAKALSNLLLIKPSPKVMARLSGWPPLRVQVAPFVPEQLREEIAEDARKRRQVSALYNITGWTCCREKAKGSALDTMMSGDLGM
ncbi:hypothetical protein [Pseudomonas amygdali]|uniref:hypothetical protein n=1 Tax=Pseudomonas amygdali TaxID=47877 RepID=UPI000208CFDA|nr:hypothetical protein [Pseudomonas amygdali]RMT05864.1 hypothetical protein ALP54_03590 [Pseudomonas amygdali pv. lachrymans]